MRCKFKMREECISEVSFKITESTFITLSPLGEDREVREGLTFEKIVIKASGLSGIRGCSRVVQSH